MSRTGEYFTQPEPHELVALQSEQITDLRDRLAERDAHVDALMTRVSVLTVSLSNIRHALVAWADTYPDLGDTHDAHARGRFLGECAGCQAELRLLNMVDKVQEVLS